MKLFDKLNNLIDYNNHYTIKKAVGILEHEFNLAIQKKDLNYARYVISTIRAIYDRLSGTVRETEEKQETASYMQKVWLNRLRDFMALTIKKTHHTFGINNVAKEIEQAIAQT